MPLILGDITTYLSEQWDKFALNFGFFTALGVVLYFILKKSIEHGFQHKLESLKLDHQKVLFNFETFNSKQNERYPQLYYLTEHALGHITSLRSIRSYPTFENGAEEDVKTYCEAIEMNAGDQNRILSLWQQDKDKAVLEIHRLKKIIDYNMAEVKWYDANDYLIYNELYFSDEVTSQTRKLLDLMHQYLLNLDPVYYNPIYMDDLKEMRKENSVIKPQIEEQRKIWKAIMKKEVSGQVE